MEGKGRVCVLGKGLGKRTPEARRAAEGVIGEGRARAGRAVSLHNLLISSFPRLASGVF